MFEKFKDILDKGMGMITEGLSFSEKKDEPPACPDVPLEQLIKEAKEYVDSIIVTGRSK